MKSPPYCSRSRSASATAVATPSAKSSRVTSRNANICSSDTARSSAASNGSRSAVSNAAEVMVAVARAQACTWVPWLNEGWDRLDALEWVAAVRVR
jgi:hypothetical protein